MTFIFLDGDFAAIGKVNDVIIARWIRRYYSAGEFMLYLPIDQYNSEAKYVYTPDRPEAGVIMAVEYDRKESGDFVTISGMFCEKLLDRNIIYPTYSGSGTIETVARTVCSTYKGDLPITLGETHGLGTSIRLQETGAQLGEKLYDLLKTQEMSPRVRIDYDNMGLIFDVFQGVDRTYSQQANNYVVFSERFHNISASTYSFDSSGMKNYAVIGGQGEGSARVYTTVDNSGTDDKRSIFVDARDLQKGDDETDAEYTESLQQRGREALDDYKTSESISFTPLAQGFRYLTDYDLGDKVDVEIARVTSFSGRIEEITETYKNGDVSIALKIGTPTPSIYGRLKAKGKS